MVKLSPPPTPTKEELKELVDLTVQIYDPDADIVNLLRQFEPVVKKIRRRFIPNYEIEESEVIWSNEVSEEAGPLISLERVDKVRPVVHQAKRGRPRLDGNPYLKPRKSFNRQSMKKHQAVDQLWRKSLPFVHKSFNRPGQGIKRPFQGIKWPRQGTKRPPPMAIKWYESPETTDATESITKDMSGYKVDIPVESSNCRFYDQCIKCPGCGQEFSGSYCGTNVLIGEPDYFDHCAKECHAYRSLGLIRSCDECSILLIKPRYLIKHRMVSHGMNKTSASFDGQLKKAPKVNGRETKASIPYLIHYIEECEEY